MECLNWRCRFLRRPSIIGLLSAALFFVPAGCSEIKSPTMHEALTHPFGTGAPFTLGTTTEKVLRDWGPPASKVPQGVDELGNIREEWIYHGMLPGLPIDQEYISRTHHLYFEGGQLVRWKEEAPPPG